jgi:dihydroxyacid dehydratase/phosphogluconate dehydratase
MAIVHATRSHSALNLKLSIAACWCDVSCSTLPIASWRCIWFSVAVDENNVPTDTKRQDCADAVAVTFAMLRAGVTARDIMTKKAFQNAVTVQVGGGITFCLQFVCAFPLHASAHHTIPRCQSRLTETSRVADVLLLTVAQYAIGGSTNAVLHLMALAREAGLTQEDFDITSFNHYNDTIPILINCTCLSLARLLAEV